MLKCDFGNVLALRDYSRVPKTISMLQKSRIYDARLCQIVPNYQFPKSACPQEYMLKCDFGNVLTFRGWFRSVPETSSMPDKSRIYATLCHITKFPKSAYLQEQMLKCDFGNVPTLRDYSRSVPKTISMLQKSRIYARLCEITSFLKVPALKIKYQNATLAMCLPSSVCKTSG
jgi:hypothetical protein